MVNDEKFEEAIKHLDAKPKWRDMNHYTDVVKELYFDSLRVALKLNRASYIKESLATPLVAIEAPLLTELKVVVVRLIRAERTLRRLLQKCLPYIRWTLRKRRVHDSQRMYRQYQRWVTTLGPIVTTAPEAPQKRVVAGNRKITDFFARPKRRSA